MEAESLVYPGSTIKDLGNGRIGGHLVLFTTAADPDLTGDYFTAKTDFAVKASTNPMLFYNHTFDDVIGDRELGDASVKVDDTGVWVEAQLALRDEYERKIYEMAKAGKLGWSSGTAGHLVRRKKVGKSYEITKWPIVEASLTPTPAEPRTSVMSMKMFAQSLEPKLCIANLSQDVESAFRECREWLDITRRMHETRVKAGRVLSAANRGRIASVVGQVKPLLADLEALLAETDPGVVETTGNVGQMGEEQGTDTMVARVRSLRLAVIQRNLELRLRNGPKTESIA